MFKLLLIVSLAFFLIPFQTDSQTNKAEQRKANQQPSAPVTSAPVQQSNRPAPQSVGDQHIRADVRVISTPPKDRYDKAIVWINGLLALVGMGGIVIACLTLGKIKKQADLMETQATHMGNQLAEMKQQADESRLKERAWLTVIPRKIESLDDSWLGFNFLPIDVENVGATNAFKVRGVVTAYAFIAGDDLPRTEAEALSLPDIVRPNREVNGVEATLHLGEGILQILGASQTAVKIELFGQIAYEDIFRISHTTKFHYRGSFLK